MTNKQSGNKATRDALEKAKELAQDLANVVLQHEAPPGTPIPGREKKHDEYVTPEPNTESVPPSPVTGQPADVSQHKPRH